MTARSPLDAVTQFVEAMNQGDVETALSLYEPGASLVVKPGLVAKGTVAVREALAGLAALNPTLTSHAARVVEAGDVALYCSRWTMHGTDPAGNAMQMSACSADVLRRQSGGNWLIALDNPFGTDIVV